MIRAKIATAVAAFGFLCVVSPSGVIGVLDPLPHISGATPVRSVGAVYLLAGGLVAQNVRTGRPNHSRYAIAVVVICATGLSLGLVADGGSLDPAFFFPTLCVLFPLTAGIADSAESITLSVASVFALILGGMAVYEPSVANAAGDLSIAFFAGIWIAFGLPLYAVGREWRMRVPKGDGRPGEPTV